mmetsp:Transcript_524/g.661  ORF Transcript_524/g.661 Transcript_524/m.661 type:complete len:140 (-) Transcript_524:1043-1462(-)
MATASSFQLISLHNVPPSFSPLPPISNTKAVPPKSRNSKSPYLSLPSPSTSQQLKGSKSPFNLAKIQLSPSHGRTTKLHSLLNHSTSHPSNFYAKTQSYPQVQPLPPPDMLYLPHWQLPSNRENFKKSQQSSPSTYLTK